MTLDVGMQGRYLCYLMNMSIVISFTIHERFVIFYLCILFHRQGNQFKFIDAASTSIRGTKFVFKRKSNWNIVFHPQIVYSRQQLSSMCCIEHMIMVSFKNICAFQLDDGFAMRGKRKDKCALRFDAVNKSKELNGIV